jgi:integrase
MCWLTDLWSTRAVARQPRTIRKANSRRHVPEQRRTVASVSNGEINRELTALKRMFNLAIQAGKLLQKPHIPFLNEDNVRVGFFERDQFLTMLSRLPESVRPVATFAYITGWRIDSEVLPLEWRQVDFGAGEVRLDPGKTKNGEGRTFPMTRDLRELLDQQRAITIVSAGDLREAARRLDAVTGTISGTIEQNLRSGPKV